MEVNTLTRWMSIGKNLSSLGKLEDELERIEKGMNRERTTKGLPLSPSLQQLLEQEGWLIQGGQLVRKKPPPPTTTEVLTPEFLRRSLRRFAKGFLIGWGGKSILNLLLALAKARKNPQKLVEALKESVVGQPIRYGAFLGWVLCVFETVMRFTQQTNLRTDNNTRALIAGALAGTGVAFIPKDIRVYFALFFFVRACEVLAYVGVENGLLPRIEHGDTLTMMVASAQVIWAFWSSNPSVEPSYMHFLDHQSGIVKPQRYAIIDLIAHNHLSQQKRDAANAWRTAHGLATLEKWPTIEKQFHELMHPGSSSCFIGYLRFLYKGGLQRALPVYLPVHVVPTLVFGIKKLLTNPIPVLSHIAFSVGRSSLFLASYVGFAWYVTCLAWERGWRNHYLGAFVGLMCGTQVLIEKKSRRIELGLYVMTQALYSFYRHWYLKGIFPKVPHYELFLCMFSFAILMHAYVNDPLLLRKTYFGLFKFAFGSGAHLLGFPNKQESPRSPKSPKYPLATAENSSK